MEQVALFFRSGGREGLHLSVLAEPGACSVFLLVPDVNEQDGHRLDMFAKRWASRGRTFEADSGEGRRAPPPSLSQLQLR